MVLGLALAGSSLAEGLPYAASAPVTLAEADASSGARGMTAWVLQTGDNQGLPFLIIDKIDAQVFAFDRNGRLLGTTPGLLGLARGDVAPPDIGYRALSAITPEERITPAGRFLASLGENLDGKAILWIDYDSALSLHPVITTRPADRRLDRLATVTAEDNRISYGCVNVPERFFHDILRPAFHGTVGVVYILPESGSSAPWMGGPPLG